MELLFKNITIVTMQKDCSVIQNTDVGVKNGKVTFNIPQDAKIGRAIDGSGKLLIPGLYNCHAHTPMSLLRGFANDLALEEWLFNHIFPAEQKLKTIDEGVYTGAMLSIAEMLASGTISFNDMYFDLPQIAKAVDESGVKANLSNGVLSFNPEGYNYKEESEYLETLHVLNEYSKSSNGRIKAEASIHCAYTSHPDAWLQITEFAKKNNLSMHVHLSETLTEHNKSLEMFGLTPTQAFAKYRVFDVPTLAAHACWVSEEDIDTLAEYNVSIAHNPVSNLKLASGIAPVYTMLEKGINVALGTDGMASNNTHDLFEEIKLASILQKYVQDNPTVVPAFQALEMATVNGAKAQNRQGGIIAEGYEADLVMLNMENTHQVPCPNPLINLSYSTTGRDVVMTLCQGRILYENGEFTTIDIEKIRYNSQKISEKIII